MPTEADETISGNPGMTEVVEDLSLRKARACYDAIISDDSLKEKYSDYVIIGADTIVYTDKILGKPENPDDAYSMLDSYRGTYHYVVTGISLIDIRSAKSNVMSETTKVWCVNYSDEDIQHYLSMEEPYDKAGGYGIQGRGALLIEKINGDYFNVVGLPVSRLNQEIIKFKGEII